MKHHSSLSSILLLAFAALSTMQLTALSYDSPERPDNAYSAPMRADMDFAPGRLIAADEDGYAAAAADEAGLVVLGRVRAEVSSEGLANGEKRVAFDHGVFAFDNSTAHPVTNSLMGRPVYVEDDVTVSSDPGVNGIFAGICRGFEGSGKVWVDTKQAALLQAVV